MSGKKVADNEMNLIQISQLKKSYKDFVAVNSLDLTIKKGNVHGILGPNGAGKSTLINCIVGLKNLDSGTIMYEEQNSIKKWSHNIGYVPQDLAIYPELSAYDNVKFFGSLYGLAGTALEEKVLESLEFVGLVDVKDKRSAEFSGGMKRRLNLACAITHHPKLIIMDEPTVGIDPQSRNRILENVKQLNEQGVTVIYTTHYMEEVQAICNVITVMDKGKVIANGSKEEIMQKMGSGIIYQVSVNVENGNWESFVGELKQNEKIHEVKEIMDEDQGLNVKSYTVRCENGDVIDMILQLAQKEKLSIKNMKQNEPSLEEIFLELTGSELRD